MTDKRLLLALDENCRYSYQTLADKLGMTATAVKKRVEKLLNSGVIEEFVVLLRPAMTNAEYLLALIDSDGFEDEVGFMEEIGSNDMIIQVGQIAGKTGRSYMILAEYAGAEKLQELSSFLRKYRNVTDVELHTIIRKQGKTFELKRLHLRVLRHLRKKARMQVSEIADSEGLSARRVSRAINEIQESDAFWFATRWNLSAGKSTEFWIKIRYDPRSAEPDEVNSWLNERFEQEYWYPFVSASQSVVFAKFVTDHFRDAAIVARGVKEAPFVESADVLLCYPVEKHPRYGQILLEEMLKEADLWP
ncbi:MAG: winged helix-turn-helix transcriptional regulator [Candidatus Hodarchaeota archaeon]